MKFPKNKKFAFSVFDDTDKSTIDNVKPIYDLLHKLKIYTTKSVWVYPSKETEKSVNKGSSLRDQKYLSFVNSLKNNGFEIGFHGVKGGSSKRKEIIKRVEEFRKIIKNFPKTYANHAGNKESIYWGKYRLNSPLLRFLYTIITFKRKQIFEGHLKDSKYFWGDIAKNNINYVRNFVFSGINTLKYNPSMPYHDPKKHYVNFWFSSSDGHDVNAFNKLLSEKNINQLEKEGGVCIVYTHFANDFVKDGKINSNTQKVLTNLSKRNGWFVPISTLLDFLENKRKSKNISKMELKKMEYRWFLNKIIRGTS